MENGVSSGRKQSAYMLSPIFPYDTANSAPFGLSSGATL